MLPKRAFFFFSTAVVLYRFFGIKEFRTIVNRLFIQKKVQRTYTFNCLLMLCSNEIKVSVRVTPFIF